MLEPLFFRSTSVVESIGCKQVTAKKYSEYNTVHATCALNIKSAEIAVILQFMLLNFWDDFYVERLFWLFPGYFTPIIISSAGESIWKILTTFIQLKYINLDLMK